MIDFSTDKLAESLQKRPHVVIFGADATMAAIPNGDKFGNKSSIMNNFLSELQIDNLLSSIKLETQSSNLEDIYSEIDTRKDSNLYQVCGTDIYIKTRYCYEYATYDEAILVVDYYSAKVIFLE